jgi:peroxiredoxin Q/BCP
VARAYGVVHEGRDLPERWTFFIDKDGRIVYIDRQVNPSSHGQDVVNRLKELKIK